MTSCFQPSLRDTSLLFYYRIPSYRVNREFLFGHLTTKDSQGSSHLLLHRTIQSFPIYRQLVSWVLWPLQTSHDKLYSVMVHRISHLHHAFVRPPRIRALSFHLIPTSFTPTVPNSYRALVCSATLPTTICLVWSFCSLGQMFAAGFFQIPTHDGHPCLWLCNVPLLGLTRDLYPLDNDHFFVLFYCCPANN